MIRWYTSTSFIYYNNNYKISNKEYEKRETKIINSTTNNYDTHTVQSNDSPNYSFSIKTTSCIPLYIAIYRDIYSGYEPSKNIITTRSDISIIVILLSNDSFTTIHTQYLIG